MSRVVAFGEIMLRLATPGYQRFQQAMPGSIETTFAGAEASIAASLAYLGTDAAFVTALPDHAIADACVANLRAMGVETRHLLRTPQGRLGVYYLESGANQRPGQVIYDREGSAVSLTPASAYDWPAIFSGAEWFVISGITPAISRNGFEVARTAMQQAAAHGVKVLCDMNYRAKLWQWQPGLSARELATQTMRELMPLVQLFVGGREDAEAMLGLSSSASLETLARHVAEAFPGLQHVAMTRREGISATHNNFGGLLYDRAADEVFHAPGKEQLYAITHIVDRLGAGDAFTAGLLHALLTPHLSAPAQAIAFATAAGCLAHSVPGDFHYSSQAEIESLMAGDASGRVRR